MRHIIASKNEYVNSKDKKYFQKGVDMLIIMLYTEHTNSKPQKKAKSGLKGLAGRNEKAACCEQAAQKVQCGAVQFHSMLRLQAIMIISTT